MSITEQYFKNKLILITVILKPYNTLLVSVYSTKISIDIRFYLDKMSLEIFLNYLTTCMVTSGSKSNRSELKLPIYHTYIS